MSSAQANTDPTILAVEYITLPHKPTAKLAYTFIPSKGTPTSTSQSPLLVFLTGLGLPASSYHPTIFLLTSLPTHPALLTYDRYGQGLSTDRDPVDLHAIDKKHGHTVLDVVEDLHILLATLSKSHNLRQNTDPNAAAQQLPPVIFIANSIGCAIARLYASTHPNTVSGLLLLDSVVANTDFVSIYPDPDTLSPSEMDTLPEGVTPQGLRTARQKMAMIFHPSQGSAEGLSRKNLASLLPDADGPRLLWNDEKEASVQNEAETPNPGPWVTVIGHGPAKFTMDSFRGMGVPTAETNAYANPHWHEYNTGLTKITSAGRARGPIIAEKAGHFVQKDDPELVAEEVAGMLKQMGWDV